jgi:hypothetical protein
VLDEARRTFLDEVSEIGEALRLRRRLPLDPGRPKESWEDGEGVEENHIDTRGHRARPPWKANRDPSWPKR